MNFTLNTFHALLSTVKIAKISKVYITTIYPTIIDGHIIKNQSLPDILLKSIHISFSNFEPDKIQYLSLNITFLICIQILYYTSFPSKLMKEALQAITWIKISRNLSTGNQQYYTHSGGSRGGVLGFNPITLLQYFVHFMQTMVKKSKIQSGISFVINFWIHPYYT